MPVSDTLRPAPEEMLTMRPARAAFMCGTTARVQRKALVRLASTTARQSAGETSSSGFPTWPTTPPALLTRTSTGPMRSTSAATASGSLRSALSRSTRCTVAPSASSPSAIAAPMPWAVPVTSATVPSSSATVVPAVLDEVADLLDAGLPDTQDVLVGPLVEPAELAVAEQLADGLRVARAQRADVLHRLLQLRLLDAGEARPGEVLEPRAVAGHGVDRLHDLPGPR